MRRVLTAAALALVAGCGNGGGESGVATLAGDRAQPTPAASRSADPDEAFRQFAKCMREQGVDLPDPGSGDGGTVVVAPTAAPRRVQEAERACGHLLDGVVGEGPGALDPATQDRALKFARCMREHGVDLPDPGSDGAIRKRVGEPGDIEAPFDPKDPKLQAAHEACGHLFEVTVEGGGRP